jgi:hypothetical protein
MSDRTACSRCDGGPVVAEWKAVGNTKAARIAPKFGLCDMCIQAFQSMLNGYRNKAAQRAAAKPK